MNKHIGSNFDDFLKEEGIEYKMIYKLVPLGKYLNITESSMRVYLAHYTLAKHITSAITKGHALSVIVLQEFIADFINYLSTSKRKKFNQQRINFVKTKLEELLKCEQATA